MSLIFTGASYFWPCATGLETDWYKTWDFDGNHCCKQTLTFGDVLLKLSEWDSLGITTFLSHHKKLQTLIMGSLQRYVISLIKFEIAIYIYIYICVCVCVCLYACCPWCYCHWKWTGKPEFKSWTRLLAFHIVLIPLDQINYSLFCY